jgi:hypothetical protein
MKKMLQLCAIDATRFSWILWSIRKQRNNKIWNNNAQIQIFPRTQSMLQFLSINETNFFNFFVKVLFSFFEIIG